MQRAGRQQQKGVPEQCGTTQQMGGSGGGSRAAGRPCDPVGYNRSAAAAACCHAATGSASPHTPPSSAAPAKPHSASSANCTHRKGGNKTRTHERCTDRRASAEHRARSAS